MDHLPSAMPQPERWSLSVLLPWYITERILCSVAVRRDIDRSRSAVPFFGSGILDYDAFNNKSTAAAPTASPLYLLDTSTYTTIYGPLECLDSKNAR